MATHGLGSLSARQPEKPRLPQLRGIANKRAQQIIMDHMQFHSSATEASFSSTATVPVLMQIDHTAPRTARTHDISHLRDKSSCLAPCIPDSLIGESDHIYETGFLPKDSSSIYHERDGLWYTKVFPSNTPSSRTDAVMLDAWITKTLDSYKRSSTGGGNKEDLARAVEDLVPILSVALHEIVRQVMHHCTERGAVLEKIWRTYVELFDRVLNEMQVALGQEKTKTVELHQVLLDTRDSLDSLKRSHPEQVQNVIAELEEQFTEKQKKVEEELQHCEDENARLKLELRTHHTELELWYPSFPLYQDSYLKNHIPHYSHHAQRGAAGVKKTGTGDEEEEVPAEVTIAEDFKRLLAVLAPEKRQAIGQELTLVLKAATVSNKNEKEGKKGGKRERLSMIVAEGQRNAERESKLAALHDEVAQQEKKIQELKDVIKDLERQEMEKKAGEENSIMEGVHVPEASGKDSDGLDLSGRRATAAPANIVAMRSSQQRGAKNLVP